MQTGIPADRDELGSINVSPAWSDASQASRLTETNKQELQHPIGPVLHVPRLTASAGKTGKAISNFKLGHIWLPQQQSSSHVRSPSRRSRAHLLSIHLFRVLLPSPTSLPAPQISLASGSGSHLGFGFHSGFRSGSHFGFHFDRRSNCRPLPP